MYTAENVVCLLQTEANSGESGTCSLQGFSRVSSFLSVKRRVKTRTCNGVLTVWRVNDMGWRSSQRASNYMSAIYTFPLESERIIQYECDVAVQLHGAADVNLSDAVASAAENHSLKLWRNFSAYLPCTVQKARS